MKTFEVTQSGITVYQDNTGLLLSQNIDSHTCIDKHFNNTSEALKFYNVKSLDQIFML